MLLPRAISDEFEAIEDVVRRWPFPVESDAVLRWVLQFDTQDQSLAIRVLRFLNVVGQNDIDKALEVVYSKLERKAVDKNTPVSAKNTLFAGLGDAGKSGGMIGYHFRLINELSVDNFLDEESWQHIEKGRVENLVLVDDIVSSGDQSVGAIKEISGKVLPLGVKNIFLLTVCGYEKGLRRVWEETNAHAFAAYEYADADTVASLDSTFYEGVAPDRRAQMLERLREYGQLQSKGEPLGYHNVGGLIAFQHNPPNSTLPIVWGDRRGWLPLFRRVRGINGIRSYYQQIDSALQKKSDQVDSGVSRRAASKPIEQMHVNLFVEGRLDELFFDELVKDHELAKLVGVKEASVIAIGGAGYSVRLAELLAGTSDFGLMVADGDSHSMRLAARRKEEEKALPVVHLRPNFLGLLRWEAFKHDEIVVRAVQNGVDIEGSVENALVEIERRGLRVWKIESLQSEMKRLVDSYLDQDALAGFASQVRDIILTKQREQSSPERRAPS